MTTESSQGDHGLLSNGWIKGAIVLFALCMIGGVLSGLGSKWGWWHFGTGFSILRWSVYGGILTVCVSLVALGISWSRGQRKAMIASGLVLVMCGIIVGVPVSWYRTAKSVPPIHDITTDTNNPPEFQAVVPLRKDSQNALKYGGEDVARQQKEAYPEIQSLTTDWIYERVFGTVRKVARDMEWTIHRASKEQGRVEATDTTFWFGFKDDIMVRLTKKEGGVTVIDVRSQSRVGKSDVGTNAQRIRHFLRTLEQRLK